MAKYKQTSLLPYPPPLPSPGLRNAQKFWKVSGRAMAEVGRNGRDTQEPLGALGREKRRRGTQDRSRKTGQGNHLKKKSLTVLAVGERDPLGR